MKKASFTIIASLIAPFFISNNSTLLHAVTGTEIEELFSEIMSKERRDIKDKITNTNDPFSRLKIEHDDSINSSSAKQGADANSSIEIYALKAVINGNAKINDKWYRVGDQIDTYRVGSIKNGAVVLLPEGTGENLQTKKLHIENSNNLNIKAVQLNEKKQSK